MLSKRFPVIFALLFVSLFLFFAFEVKADESPGGFGVFRCIDQQVKDCKEYTSDPSLTITHQLYKAEIRVDHFRLDNDRSAVRVDACISQSAGGMWNGQCEIIYDVTLTGPDRPGVDNSRTTTVQLNNLSDTNDYNAVNFNIRVDNAEGQVVGTAYYRRVSIESFSSSKNPVKVGEQFNISWDTDWATEFVKLKWTGAVGTNENLVLADGSEFFTANQAGTANFTLEARGPDGNEPITESRTVSVTVEPVEPAPSPTPTGTIRSDFTTCTKSGSQKCDNVLNYTTTNATTRGHINRIYNSGPEVLWRNINDLLLPAGTQVDADPAAGTYVYILYASNPNFSDPELARTQTITIFPEGGGEPSPPPGSFSLTVNKSGSGTVTGLGINCGLDCTENFSQGSSVNLTATPDSGWAFSGWTGDCGTTASNPLSCSMNSNKIVTATFTSVVPQVVCSPSSQSVIPGQTAGLAASGGDGNYSWSAPGGSPSSGSGPTFNVSYSAAGDYDVAVTSAGQGAHCAVIVSSTSSPTGTISITSKEINTGNPINTNWTLYYSGSIVNQETGISSKTYTNKPAGQYDLQVLLEGTTHVFDHFDITPTNQFLSSGGTLSYVIWYRLKSAPPPPTGTISIVSKEVVTGNLVNTNWTLSGPAAKTGTNISSATYTNMPAGQYDLQVLLEGASHVFDHFEINGVDCRVSTCSQTLSSGGTLSYVIWYRLKPGAPSVTITADSTNIAYNTGTTIRWSSQNTSSCTVSPNGWTGTSGEIATGNLTSTTTYTANCQGTNGSPAQNSVTVNVGGAGLSVALAVAPNSGVAPLAVNLSAAVSGSATGTINYSFWWDCGNSTTSVSNASSACGSLPSPSQGSCSGNSSGFKCNGVSGTSQSASTTYTASGTKVAKVIVERGSASPAQAQTNVVVSVTTPTCQDQSATNYGGSLPCTYLLSVGRSGSGSGTVNSSSPDTGINCGSACSKVYSSGTPVSLTAVAAFGSEFKGWSGNCSGTGSCSLTMDGPKSVTATFDKKNDPTVNLFVEKNGSGSGTVIGGSRINCGSVCSANFNRGDMVGLDATPDSGSTFAGWSSPCSGTGGCVFQINSNQRIFATFDALTQTPTPTLTPTCQDPSASNYGGPLPCVYPPPGSVTESCTVDVTTPPPSVSNVTVTEPNYCLSGPAATIGWTYSDPLGSPQSAYQVQIDDQGPFNSPEWDSDKISCSDCRSNSTPQGYLRFNATFRARVRAWNQNDIASDWTVSSTWQTPNNAYPQVNFTFASAIPGQQNLIPEIGRAHV